jgi:hypothetical protein
MNLREMNNTREYKQAKQIDRGKSPRTQPCVFERTCERSTIHAFGIFSATLAACFLALPDLNQPGPPSPPV